MKLLRIPPQFTRLLFVTAAILVLYFGARYFLVPDSFGKYGWYRAAALDEQSVLPIRYAGSSACLDCHGDVAEMKSAGGHKLINCESCHGPQAAHAVNPDVLPEKMENRKFCIRCHEMNPSRPKSLPQVVVAEHSGEDACMDCHVPHLPTEAP